jgi:hypothetical protein
MPPAATFPPPDRDIIEEIATGDSLVFLALDAELAADGVPPDATLSREAAL